MTSWLSCCADIRNISLRPSSVQPLWIEKAPDLRITAGQGPEIASQEAGAGAGAGFGAAFGAIFAAVLAALVAAGFFRGRLLQAHIGSS